MIEALFVGGPLHGRVQALQRPFPTYSVHEYNGKRKKNDAYLYKLDMKNYEPYVYVLAGLNKSMREFMYEKALQVMEFPARLRWVEPY